MDDAPIPDTGLLATETPGDNAPALSVSELSAALKRSVEDGFGHVRVRGEISGFKRVGSGHCYFTLKDDGACIDAVIWRGQAAAIRFQPEDGIEVIATGKLTTYPARSRYQIVVEHLELAGRARSWPCSTRAPGAGGGRAVRRRRKRACLSPPA